MQSPAPPRSLRRRVEAGLFDGGLALFARIARTPGLRGLIVPVMHGLAWSVRTYRQAPATKLSSPEQLGQQWQRLMPNPKVMPITHVDEHTAYGEIRVHCPLRGTGDVRACHRLMAYDRGLMRPSHARFVVLQSQAEPGVTACKIAIRNADVSADDLVEAHVRATAGP